MKALRTNTLAGGLLVVALGTFASYPVSAQVAGVRTFSTTVLNSPAGFSDPFAESITNSGDVVGWASTTTGVIRAVKFSTTTGTNLTPFLGSSFNSFALDANASGQVAGYSYDRFDFNLTPHATMYALSANLQTALGALPGSTRTDSQALAVNSSGQTVGWALDSAGRMHAVEFSLAGNVVLGGNFSQAFDINDPGQVVGVFSNRATLFSSGGIVDLGSLYGQFSHSSAVAINNAGWAVGHSEASESERATLFRDGLAIDLGTLGGNSRATDINGSGWIVGHSEKAVGIEEFRNTPFLWTERDGMVALEDLIDPSSGWQLSQDEDTSPIINDAGQIVVKAFNPLVGDRLLLLTLSPVPEPAQWAYVIVGVWSIAAITRRRRR